MTKESPSTRLALVEQRVEDMKNSMVSKEEFEPVKKIIYGLVGLILVAVVGALISLILKQGGQ